MNKKLLSVIIAVCCLFAVIFFASTCTNCNCSGTGDISVVEENLIVDYTCYKGNTHCPKLSVKIKNNSGSTYYVYFDANFYYKGELLSSVSSAGQTLSGGDAYTFTVQSTRGTNLFMDTENWTYKITNIHSLRK